MSYTEQQYQALLSRQTKPGATLPAAKKRSKHGNKKTIMGGRVFASGHEARRFAELELMQHAAQIRNLQRQVPFDMVVNAQHVCTYVADATYELDICAGNDSHPLARDPNRLLLVVEDCKNPKTRTLAEYRIKVKLLAACHGITIQEIL